MIDAKEQTSTRPKRNRTNAMCWYGIDRAISSLCNLRRATQQPSEAVYVINNLSRIDQLARNRDRKGTEGLKQPSHQQVVPLLLSYPHRHSI